MVGPKKQDFWPRINLLKGKYFVNAMNDGSSKSTKIVLSKLIFDIKMDFESTILALFDEP